MNNFVAYVLELLEPFGQIKHKRMFGGYGIWVDGLIIAIIADDELFFKVDEQTRPKYEAINSHPFTYDGKGKTIAMSYWNIPDDILEDNAQLAEFVEDAYNVSQRAKK